MEQSVNNKLFRPGQLAKVSGNLRVEVPALASAYWRHQYTSSAGNPRYEDVFMLVPGGSVVLLLGSGLLEDAVEETWTTKRYGQFYVDFLWNEKVVRWYGYNFKKPVTHERPEAERQFATNFRNFFTILS